MKIVGIMPVKNEGWVLGLSARVALKWVDELIVGMHDCTDDTWDIIDAIHKDGGAIRGGELPAGEWREMEHRQSLLQTARTRGATHIAIIDADEVLTADMLTECRMMDGRTGPRVRNMIPQSAGLILQLPGYNLRNHRRAASNITYVAYHNNGVWGKRWFSLAFQDEAPRFDQQRLSWSGDKFHSREPGGRSLHAVQPIAQDAGGIFHLWGASERRLIAKHKLYKAIERLRWPDKPVKDIDTMYSWATKGEENSSYGTPATWTYSPVPTEWWRGYEDLLKYLDLDREPWQEAELIRLVKEYGPRMFEGLHLFE